MNNSLGLSNIREALQKAEYDEAVGIKIVKLTGDDTLAFYAAEIDGHKRVGAHYHQEGVEIYQVIEGQGNIYIGSPRENDQVDWQKPVSVQEGDCFTVNAGEVHQLVNSSNEKLVIIFACPYSHISTDRTIVKGVGE